jgi:hypothetical protein
MQVTANDCEQPIDGNAGVTDAQALLGRRRLDGHDPRLVRSSSRVSFRHHGQFAPDTLISVVIELSPMRATSFEQIWRGERRSRAVAPRETP